MTKILVLSDTHIPVAAHDLPAAVYNTAKEADIIFHAGDFIDARLLDKLRSMKEVKAVYGNMDSQALKDCLNVKEVITIGRFRIGLIHGYGAPSEMLDTVRKEFGKVDCIVFGHSHSAVNVRKDGILYFNPGSPTDRIFSTKNSYGILEIADKRISGEIIEL
jgi:putative phosphoesterase